jgi:hypothetical protein
MYQKDYILRMIEMLGDLIRGILGLITRGDLKQADEKLSEAYYTMLRKDAWVFQNIPIHELTKRLLEEHNFTNGHLEILAELFYAEANLKSARKKFADSLLYLEKSLVLFEFVDQTGRTFSNDRQEKMEQIRKRILEIGGIPPA